MSDPDVYIPSSWPWSEPVRHWVTPPYAEQYVENYREQMGELWYKGGLVDAEGRLVVKMTAPVNWDPEWHSYIPDYEKIVKHVIKRV